MITLAARALNSICIQRILGVEERAKQQRNLPMMISLGDLGKRAGRAENVAPMLKKVRLTVERSVYRQQASNRQHGSRLFAFIHRVMPVSKRTCHFESESLISIAHFRKIMIAVCGSSKTDHELWKTSAGVQYRSALQTGVCCFRSAPNLAKLRRAVWSIGDRAWNFRPPSDLISGVSGADHADLETCSRVEMSVMQEGAIRASGRLRGVAEWMHPPLADTVLSAQS